jgi:glycosyltransferase involved in cell wall biosynthesis
MEKITVLMSVLNGEKFLSEQLESIFAQEDCNFEVHIADNGSHDETINIVYGYLDLGLVSSIIHVAEKGYNNSFFELIEKVDSETYVAFADQDDVWYPKKLSVLLNNMTKSDYPEMIFSDREFIDSNGKLIKRGVTSDLNLSWQNAVIQNVVPGNTILLNPAAIKLVRSLGAVSVSHYDAWIYLLVSLYGDVRYLPEVLVSYRLHSENSVGVRRTWTPWLWFKGVDNYLEQVRILERLIVSKKLPNPPQDFLKFILLFSHRNPLLRVSVIFRCSLYRQSKLETFFFKLAMLPILIVRRKLF